MSFQRFPYTMKKLKILYFRHVSESKWSLKPLFKSKDSLLNWFPGREDGVVDAHAVIGAAHEADPAAFGGSLEERNGLGFFKCSILFNTLLQNVENLQGDTSRCPGDI